MVRDLATGRATKARVGVDNPIARLVFSARGLLAVSHGRGLSVFPVTDGRIAQGAGGKTLTDQIPGEIAFSPDGIHLAASTPRDVNGLRVWHVGDDEPRLLAGDEQAGASALAFTGDGRLLLAGGFRGGIEARPPEDLRPDQKWTMPANRAKILHLAASPSRRFLLMINDLGLCRSGTSRTGPAAPPGFLDLGCLRRAGRPACPDRDARPGPPREARERGARRREGHLRPLVLQAGRRRDRWRRRLRGPGAFARRAAGRRRGQPGPGTLGLRLGDEDGTSDPPDRPARPQGPGPQPELLCPTCVYLLSAGDSPEAQLRTSARASPIPPPRS